GYCFAADNVAQKQMMSLDTAKKALDMLVELSGTRKNLEVDFFGGEPTLNFAMIQQAVAYGRSLEKKHNKIFRFTMTTNALHLTEEMIDFLCAEMYNVVLSIDGREAVHDHLRPTKNQKGSQKTILQNIERFVAKRGKGQYYVRGTFTAHNLDFAKDVLYLADLGFDQISLEPVVLPDTHALAIKPEHLTQIATEYDTLAKEYLQRRKGKGWFNFFHFYIDLKGGPCESKRLSGCGAGCEYLAVSPSGEIYPCHQFVGMEPYKLGDLASGLHQDAKAPFETNDITTKAHCQKCFAKYYCSGGCIANAAQYAGGLDGQYATACEVIKKRIETALGIYGVESEYDTQTTLGAKEPLPDKTTKSPLKNKAK
ncbi:MAG: thioether cross-link-forming SCIFF peptide maturase, partial [Firmicutes bacterium]|nr:thioether cross-link-forming SCIFF peptide maturase [Bacillota bacterium]